MSQNILLENSAKSPFAVPHTLFGRAVLGLGQFSSLSDSTAQSSVQNPNSLMCDGLSLHGQAGSLSLAIVPFCEVFQLFPLICLITKLESDLVKHILIPEEGSKSKNIMGHTATAIGLLSSPNLHTCSCHHLSYILNV